MRYHPLRLLVAAYPRPWVLALEKVITSALLAIASVATTATISDVAQVK